MTGSESSLHLLLMAILDMCLQLILPIATLILTFSNRAMIEAHSRLMLFSVTLHIRATREGLVAGGTGRASSTDHVAMMCRRMWDCAAEVSIGGHVHGWSDGLGNALTLEPTWIDSLVLSPPSCIESADTQIILAKAFFDLRGIGKMSLNVGVEGVQSSFGEGCVAAWEEADVCVISMMAKDTTTRPITGFRR